MDPEKLVAAVHRRTGQIVTALRDLDEDALLAPSALPGWSRLTIACHLRYGAGAHLRLTMAIGANGVAAYYPGGRAAMREHTLRPGSEQSPVAVVADLAGTSAALHREWRKERAEFWERRLREPTDNPDLGPVTAADLALLRLTEVEVHGTDLDLDLPDWSPAFVEAALPFRLDWLNRRRSNHRDVDQGLSGAWLLVATDGPTWLVTVDGDRVDSRPAEREASASAVLTASSRDLLAVLLGRDLTGALTVTGDEGFGQSFSRAFPGP